MDWTTIITFQVMGNEFWRYLVFVALLLLTYPVGKTLSWIVRKYVMRWVDKTDVKFLEAFVRSLASPVTLFVLAFLVYVGDKWLLDVSAFRELYTQVFNFLLIIPLVFFMMKFSTEVVAYYLKKTKKGENNEAAIDLLTSILKVTLGVIGVLLILSNLGYNISALLAGLGVGGLAFALAAQDILKNFFAGISLIFDKTFNKDERVKFNDTEGFIEELKLRSTKVRTYDGTQLTIPNAMLADNIVENITRVPKVKISMQLGLTYDTSSEKLEKAKQIIEDAIKNDKDANKQDYWIWFDSFGDYSLNLYAIFYGELTMDDWPERAYFKERINMYIKKEFEKEGIEFAFPTQTIELKK